MNLLELKMVDALKDLKENHHVIGIKAEFEAEGTRLEEALRLKEVITRAGLDLTIKIGGCEALKDMYDARSIGVAKIVAPMIESPYALKKYISATKLAFPEKERQTVNFLINLETITGYENFDKILASENSKELYGIVLGRVDMTGSLGLKRSDINSDKLFDIANNISLKSKERSLRCLIGGGVDVNSLPFFKKLKSGTLDCYETRKIIFKCPGALDKNAEKGLIKAVGFELMWLKNKRDFYGMIYEEDKHRIEMLDMRHGKMVAEIEGESK